MKKKKQKFIKEDDPNLYYVFCHWLDAAGEREIGERTKACGIRCVTVGWLYSYTNKGINIAQEFFEDGSFRDLSNIPFKMIINLEFIKAGLKKEFWNDPKSKTKKKSI